MQYLGKLITSSYKYCLVGLIGIALSQSAMAQSRNQTDTSGPFFGNEAKGKWLIGIKAGKIDNNAEDIDDSSAFGILLGYEFAKPVGIGGSSTIELEYVTGNETEVLNGAASYEAEMLNLFLTYRSPGTLYYKFKLGLSYSNIDVSGDFFGLNVPPANDLGDFNDIPFNDLRSQEDVALAGGVGLGVRINEDFTVELEHVADAGDNDLSLTTLTGVLRFR